MNQLVAQVEQLVKTTVSGKPSTNYFLPPLAQQVLFLTWRIQRVIRLKRHGATNTYSLIASNAGAPGAEGLRAWLKSRRQEDEDMSMAQTQVWYPRLSSLPNLVLRHL